MFWAKESSDLRNFWIIENELHFIDKLWGSYLRWADKFTGLFNALESTVLACNLNHHFSLGHVQLTADLRVGTFLKEGASRSVDKVL